MNILTYITLSILSILGIIFNYMYDTFILILCFEIFFVSILAILSYLFIITNSLNYISLFIILLSLSSAESAILISILLYSSS